MIKAGIIGATGYAGSELVRILMQHPEVKLRRATAHSYIGKTFDQVYESHRGFTEIMCEEENIEEIAADCDVVFLALPHGIAAKKVTRSVLEKTRVIDFGGDFRLKDAGTYEKWYELPHEGIELLPEAVYGLSELNREKIKSARLIANPGCYTTCSILALAPLLGKKLIDPRSIIVDAKSGVSGAGRNVTIGSLFCEVNENIRAYKIAAHRHTPEIEEQLSYAAGEDIIISFTPHLVPMNRGILATCYGNLLPGVTDEDIRAAYGEFYGNEYFIRLAKPGRLPETRWVKASNFTDIGFKSDPRTGRIIVVAALDNLMKGAAGQAVQNMNIMFGMEETAGLKTIPVFPV